MSLCAIAPRMPTSIVRRPHTISTLSSSPSGKSSVCARMIAYTPTLVSRPANTAVTGRGRGGVGVGQPRRQREHRRLDAERHEQHTEDGGARAGRDAVEAGGHVGEVEGSGGRVGERDARQEDQRRHHRHHHVRHTRTDAVGARTERQQHEAGGEEHLEADVQIEQVARQERVGDARRQRQIRRQEDRDGLVLTAVADALTHGVRHDGEQHDRRDHQHHRGQPVDHQRDADRRIPATHLNGRRPVAVGQEQQQSATRRGRRSTRRA